MLYLMREPVVKETPQKEPPHTACALLLGAILVVKIPPLIGVTLGNKLQNIKTGAKNISESQNQKFNENVSCLVRVLLWSWAVWDLISASCNGNPSYDFEPNHTSLYPLRQSARQRQNAVHSEKSPTQR